MLCNKHFVAKTVVPSYKQINLENIKIYIFWDKIWYRNTIVHHIIQDNSLQRLQYISFISISYKVIQYSLLQ